MKRLKKLIQKLKDKLEPKKVIHAVEPIVIPILLPEPEIVASMTADGILEAIPKKNPIDFEFDPAYPREKDPLKQKLALEEYIKSPVYASKAVTAAGFELDKIKGVEYSPAVQSTDTSIVQREVI